MTVVGFLRSRMRLTLPMERFWRQRQFGMTWPNQLNLKVLHQHSPLSDPMGEEFDYAKEFTSLDLHAVIKDLHALMTSRDWWPADYGH